MGAPRAFDAGRLGGSRTLNREDLAAAALEYAGRGWPVLPLRGKAPLTAHGYKDASIDTDQIRRWWLEHSEAGIGIVVGAASGLCVLDVDPRSGGDVSLAQLVDEHGALPDTLSVATAGGGAHHYFSYNKAATRSTIAPGLELKARDGYVVAPPSRNPETGVAYTWSNDRNTVLADLPEWLLGRRKIIAREASVPGSTAEIIAEGERSAMLTSLAGTIRKRGATQAGILAFLLAENAARCLPPLPEREVERIARSVARYAPDDDTNAITLKPSWPEPISPAAFHGLAGEFVRLIEPHTEADPVALLAQFLVAAGSVIGRGPHFTVEADRHHSNEFVVLVGESSRGRKGTSWGQVIRVVRAVDPEWADQRQQGGLSSGEGLIWAVRDPIIGRSIVKDKGHVIGVEEYEDDPGVSDKRLLVFEPEFASTLRVMGRDGSTLSPVTRQAWDSGDLRVLTKKSPARATGAHISIIGHVTRDELLRYLDRTEAANGFINRFLTICVRRARILPEGGNLQDLNLGPIFEQLGRAVEWGRGRGVLARDDGARALWCERYETLSAGAPGLFGAVVSRAEAHVLRLSLIYALLDGAAKIQRTHLEAALAVWNYAEASARYVFGDALGDPVADELLNALRAQPEGLTRKEISTVVFARNRAASEITRALDALHARGLARFESEGTRGRPAERWYATRPMRAPAADTLSSFDLSQTSENGHAPEADSSSHSFSSSSASESNRRACAEVEGTWMA